MERETYLDVMKAICIVGIIFIHTTFWSGLSYVPAWVRNLALALDVPPFFFVTGALLRKKNLNPYFFLSQAFKLSFLFAGIVVLAQLLFLQPNLTDISNAIFLQNANIPQFKLLTGSYWFVPIYIKSLLVALILLKFLPRLSLLYFISGIIYITILTFFKDIKSGIFFGSSVRDVIFYSLFILLGYLSYSKNNKRFWKRLLVFSCLFSGAIWVSTPNFNMQYYKFPPTIVYFVYSLISISLFMIFKGSFSCKITQWMGQNALYLYMSQGISSSLIYGLARNLQLSFWPVKLLLIFAANLALSLAIAWCLSRLFSLVASCRIISLIRRPPEPASPTT